MSRGGSASCAKSPHTIEGAVHSRERTMSLERAMGSILEDGASGVRRPQYTRRGDRYQLATHAPALANQRAL